MDDGSTDETLELLRSRAAGDPRIKVLARPHGGIVAALQAGLEACQAELVARMDADDRALPERLAKQVRLMQARPELAVAGCLVTAFPGEQVRQGFSLYLEWQNALIEHADISREIFVESPLAHPSALFRREQILALGGYQERGWPEDYDLWLRACLAGFRFGKVPEVLLEWRERPERLTRTDSRYALESFLRLKAYYLSRGPLSDREAVFIWGAGMMGRRLSKQLLRQGVPLVAFVDIDPRKIGRTRRGLPVISAEQLPGWWQRFTRPALLAAVGARGARPLIRARLAELGFAEGQDWWLAA